MTGVRFRLRTLMIIVAFVALGVVVVMQGVQMARARVQAELFRAEAEHSRAVAEMMRVRAAQELADAQAELDAALRQAAMPVLKRTGELDRFHLQFEPGDRRGHIVVSFPDVPDAITQGRNAADAREMAEEALGLVLLNYLRRSKPLPKEPTCRMSLA